MTASSRSMRIFLYGGQFVLATALLLGGCGGDSGSTDAGERAQKTPSQSGADIYSQRCASCHGEDLRGTDRGPSHLSIVYEPNHHNDSSFQGAIRDGAAQHHWAFGDMPAIPTMSDADITAVIAYVREIQEKEGFEAYPPE